MTTANTVNIQMLKDLTNENPKYKAMYEVYGKRLRGRQDSTIPRSRRVLKEHGVDASSKEMKHFFDINQKAGAGRWVSGRHGKQGRMVWGFHLKSIADNVNGFKYELDPKGTKYVKDHKGNKLIDAVHSEYKKVPLGANDIIRPAPKSRTQLPKIIPAAKPALKAVETKPTVMSLSDKLTSRGATVSNNGRTMKVRTKGGLEIELPIGQMSQADWKDAAFFLGAVEEQEAV